MGLVRKSENLIILAPLKKTYSTRTCACAAAAVCSIVLPGLPRLRLRRASANMNKERLMKMAGAVRTGGKGTMRRKKKAVHKTATTDDKRLQSTLKRVGVNTIPAIEEVNIFKDDLVIQFVNPKVQASIAANTWVVSGTPQTKKLQDVLPGIINQLGPDNMEHLKRIAEEMQKQVAAAGAAARAKEENDDDDVPELVPGETFEEVVQERFVTCQPCFIRVWFVWCNELTAVKQNWIETRIYRVRLIGL
ncbi:hypothetical protein GUJ93_ZPchr0715g29014 [Zizania palustris]|uniref:Nascent polypeptide-associated complex subunit beta n=1 Tax=Zizania palustris TaxID=103762 RepID=A0A8J5V322_ZIZPA|nr:hypothetical protein GUJ93_ZPchr0715g29014 [Zizania palustris]